MNDAGDYFPIWGEYTETIRKLMRRRGRRRLYIL